MLNDVHELPAGAKLRTPVCVVGSGAAGITTARALAGHGIECVLLEAGGLELEDDTQALYKGKNVGVPYFALHHTRLRYFGGSTNHWTGWCRPLDDIDFESRPWLPYADWPINGQDLAPYAVAAHEILELGPLDYAADSWSQRTKQPLLPLDPHLATTAIWQFSTPTRFLRRYLDEVADSSQIQAYLYANVVDIEPAPRGRRVERVRVKALDGHEIFVYPRVLVLATGAIENARLLLQSTTGHPRGIGNRHDVVGRYFIEHPHANVGVITTTLPPEQLALYHDIYRLYEHGPPAAVRGAIAVPPHVMRRERLLGFSAALEPKVNLPPLGQGLTLGVEQLMRDLQRAGPVRQLQLYMRSEQAPNPASRVFLRDERDALGMRRLALDWQLCDRSVASMRRSIEFAAAAVGKAGVGRVYSFFHAPDRVRGSAWPHFAGGHHHMGTTRMGVDPETSVVNSDCRLHDVENFYVAGSSVFSTGGFANPTLTIVKLALRLVDHLEQRL